ncbi:MAG: hypothetical protein Q7J78_03115, partial [Clostridiales bacterium]|nr:hypothetical protein [Clostridiales bacterium]
MARQAEVAAQLGFEVFVVDYGWSISAGDRRENRERFPSGIKKISEYVNINWSRIAPDDMYFTSKDVEPDLCRNTLTIL